MTPLPVAFGPAGRQLFGQYHAPAPAVARGVGVVLCNPLGHEAMSTHRAYRELAERLAAAGLHALRFDYHGTGDSSGHADEPERVRAWLDSIGAAIDELRALTGVRVVDLVGVRFGATLAAVVAAERRDVRGLVLWAPCASGRAYVRELRAFRMIKEQAAPGAAARTEEAEEEIAGYLFARKTVADLAAIDLCARQERIADRALVIPRDDLPTAEQRLAKHLEGLGVDTLFRPEPGYASMMRDPQDSIVPFAALDAIVSWLREPGEPYAARPCSEISTSSVLTASGSRSRHRVREEAYHFGEGGGLFGILTEPASGASDRLQPAIVFLNVGANHRVGPNRMYVSLARELAALGYLAFRFDVAGLGDSRSNGAGEHRLYSTDSVHDVAAAVSLLTKLRGVERVVLVGVCSGAYLAFHSGLVDARVAGEILINPQTFEWKDDDTLALSTRKSFRSTRYYLRALVTREIWVRALRGNLHPRTVAGVLGQRLATLATARFRDSMARLRGEPPPRTEIERAFCAMSDRGIESLLVFSSNDGGLDMIEKHLGRDASRVRARTNIRVAIIEDADHTFTLLRWQQELSTLITSFVERAFPRAREVDGSSRSAAETAM